MTDPVKIDNLPARNKNNFKLYHDPNFKSGPPKLTFTAFTKRKSVYAAAPDRPLEQKIVNEPKPQVLIKYMKFKKKNTSSSQASNASRRVDGTSGLNANKRAKTSHVRA